MNRDLDAEISEKIYKWVYVKIGPDVGGNNAGEVLFFKKELTSAAKSILPPKGPVHKSYFTDRYSRVLDHAQDLARHVKLPIIERDWPEDPEELSKLCLKFWEDPKSIDPSEHTLKCDLWMHELRAKDQGDLFCPMCGEDLRGFPSE
jgi:hypothetical protein